MLSKTSWNWWKAIQNWCVNMVVRNNPERKLGCPLLIKLSCVSRWLQISSLQQQEAHKYVNPPPALRTASLLRDLNDYSFFHSLEPWIFRIYIWIHQCSAETAGVARKSWWPRSFSFCPYLLLLTLQLLVIVAEESNVKGPELVDERQVLSWCALRYQMLKSFAV